MSYVNHRAELQNCLDSIEEERHFIEMAMQDVIPNRDHIATLLRNIAQFTRQAKLHGEALK